MEFIKNTKGGSKLCLNGFMYNKHVEKEILIYWRCTKHNLGCKGRLRTSVDNDHPNMTSGHNHDPDQATIDVAKARATMKQEAKSDSKLWQIVTRVMATVPVEAQAFLPQTEICKRSIRNEKSRNMPIDPPDLNDLIIENEWALTMSENGNRPTPSYCLIMRSGMETE